MTSVLMHWYTIFNKGRSFSFVLHAYDMQLILATVSYKAITLTPKIFMGKFASAFSHIWMCIILAGSCTEQYTSYMASKSACHHSLPSSSSEEVSWQRFPILSSISYFIILSHYNYSHIIQDINGSYGRCQSLYKCHIFIELLGTVLGVNHTVFVPIVEVLVVTTFRVMVKLITVGYTGGVWFGDIYWILFLNCQFICFAFANSLRIVDWGMGQEAVTVCVIVVGRLYVKVWPSTELVSVEIRQSFQ